MEFYQTVMEKRFFESQLPQLIKALHSLVSALEKRETGIQLPVEVPEDFLDDLYLGNVEIGVHSSDEYCNESMKEMIVLQNMLKQELSAKQYHLFEKYCEVSTRYSSKESCRMFRHGYQLAIRLITAGLKG